MPDLWPSIERYTEFFSTSQKIILESREVEAMIESRRVMMEEIMLVWPKSSFMGF